MHKLYPLLVFPAAILILYLMHRPWICACNTIRLWVSEANGPQTSQQLLDWYSLTHVMHGMIICLLLTVVCRRMGWRMSWPRQYTIALLFGAAWEIIENSPFIVERYRQSAIANGYTGDTILNSTMDIVCVALGFFLARNMHRTWVIPIILAAELLLLFVIHDNLLLNIIQLIHPIPALQAWQATAP